MKKITLNLPEEAIAALIKTGRTKNEPPKSRPDEDFAAQGVYELLYLLGKDPKLVLGRPVRIKNPQPTRCGRTLTEEEHLLAQANIHAENARHGG